MCACGVLFGYSSPGPTLKKFTDIQNAECFLGSPIYFFKVI